MDIIVLGTSNEWCKASWQKNISLNKIRFFNSKIPFEGNVLKKRLCNLLFSVKLNKKIRIPLKKPFYTNIDRCLKIGEEETIMFVYDWHRFSFDPNLIKYLKEKHDNLKVCYLFSNIVEKSGAKEYKVLDSLKSTFDYVFAFDKNDASKYGFDYNYLIYERDEIEACNVVNDIFFVGQAKNRLEEIIDVFNIGVANNLRCDFHCTNVDHTFANVPNEIIESSYMKYDDVISHLLKSRCILDIMQKNSIGITLNICEAIIYNKKIITNNCSIKNEPFFKKENIYILGDNTNSIKDFLDSPFIEYSDDEKKLFSLEQLINNMRKKNEEEQK
ncbi:MAG: hypothetical protein LKE36_03305 [Bacilli bacterium]|jgi:hypothetical protein|nr:hypothetical protein [Bacilli bacterium]